ncbi:p53-like transcription factor, DNA-binding,p53, DNA-binding domain,p53 tumour suppressor family,p53/RUNT- [Cinara cedri]|uniref:p53-like transcription factor, DNA-binding,p53, DNA-binding domain,p53 tumour suppressor family,p53/RUNT n=1 Tax=Cinara cedri TaxID=506608 RepID=A0A5E4N5X8_9HEMI|nr:p53-like transcription factor, DNA-binding,p53, DNA-binding domain,p53 tumour suppressor family,p53/RUNT- [Cinara cedri]
MMDEPKFEDLSNMQLVNEDIFNFDQNDGNFQVLNPLLHNFDEIVVNPHSEYCFTTPMENGIIVDLNYPQIPEKENCGTCTTGSVKSRPTGIIPCQDEFGGHMNFEVMLDSSSQSYRQKWHYSVALQKIFIDIDNVLLLNFKYDYEKIPCDIPLFVRAMPMYSAANWLKEPVERCLQHLSPIDQLNKSFTHLEHVLRCDNDSTTYHIDQNSKRKSVVTLLSRPEHGSDSTRLSYRFVCKTSCFSGMQRRPIIVIFTLEDNNGQVLGRRILPVKICSCPKRDMEREEQDTKLKKNTVFRRNKKCITQKNHHHHHHHHYDNGSPPNKLIKIETSTESETEIKNDNPYTLPFNYVTNKKENYKIILENVYTVVAGASLLHNIKDTKPFLDDLKSKLDNLK